LKQWRFQTGLTLVELAVGLGIVGMMLALGVAGLTRWVPNAQIRATADAIQSGLQLARAEAVQRNAPVRFQLTTGVTNACAVSATGTSWVVSLNDASGKCASAPADPPSLPALPDGSDPYIIQTRSAAEGSGQVTVTADQATVMFGGLGRVTPQPADDIDIDLTNPNGGDCAADGGPMRCLRVVVSIGGQIRMCDPAVTLANDPKGC